MKNLLFIRLKKMDFETFNNFCSYIESPYFLKSKNNIEFINLIRFYYPEFKIPIATQNKVFNIFSSKTAYNVFLSRLNKEIDTFEVYELFKRKEYLKESLFYEIQLEKKSNTNLYNKTQINNCDLHYSSDQFYKNFRIEFAKITLCEDVWLTDKVKIFNHSDNAMQYLFDFFITKYLQIYANKKTHTLNLKEKPKNSKQFDLIIKHIEQEIEHQPIVVRILYSFICLHENIYGDDIIFNINYNKIKELTFSLSNDSFSDEIVYVLMQLFSACIYKSLVDASYLNKAFEVIKFLIETKLFFQLIKDQNIQIQSRFILIVKVGLSVQQYQWVDFFIEEHINLIEKEYKDAFYHYAKGLILFYKQEYDLAISEMLKINTSFNIPQFVADYKLTLLKMYFELRNIITFRYQAETFKKYIAKNKNFTTVHKKNIVDSIYFMKLILSKKQKQTKEDILIKIRDKKLEYLIENYRDKWYLEKLNEIK